MEPVADTCTYCPKMCRHSCPVSTASAIETQIPQAKVARLAQLRRGRAAWTVPETDPLWACTGCRHCTSYCVHGVEPAALLFAGRAEAVQHGAEHPALVRYPERFRAREERLARVARERLPHARFAESANVGFWPGCDAIDRGDADVRAQLALLENVGADHVRLVDSERVCGGYPLLAAGHPEAFRWHATRVAEELRRYRTVVMSCSACVHAVRTIYPAEGIVVPAEVVHLTEYLVAFAERVLPRSIERGPVYYHDPCYLARHQQVLEPPRRLLERVAEVREFGWSHGDTECCGGGGLLPKTMPEVASRMARRRLREVVAAGGGTVATSCSTCKRMLEANAPPGVEVRDVVELVHERSQQRAAASSSSQLTP